MYNQNSVGFQIAFGNKTDFGRVRQRNEDYMESFESQYGHVFVVCDGMGGHVGGEIASRLAASTIKNVFLSNPNKLTSPSELIEEGIVEANRAVYNKSIEDASLKGMGTTCVVLVIKDGIIFYGHAGDSRLYIIRANKIYQLTKDHSFVQSLVDQGLISDAEAENHPRKNEITKALGISPSLVPEIARKGMLVYTNDFLILCSDGLSNMVSEREMMETIISSEPFDACNRLVEMANVAGGTDNITIQIVKVISGQDIPEEMNNAIPEGAVQKSVLRNQTTESSDTGYNYIPETNNNKKSPYLLYILIGILILLIAGLIYIFFFYDKEPDIPETKDTTEIIKENKAEGEFNREKTKEDLTVILKYIFESAANDKNIKFENNNFNYTNSEEKTFSYSIESLRELFTKNPKRNVTIKSCEVNYCEYIINDDGKKLEYELQYKRENNKIKFEKIIFKRDLTPPPVPKEEPKIAPKQQPKDKDIKQKEENKDNQNNKEDEKKEEKIKPET
jgi:serine/threonine protein phosphatase PrpC